MSNMSYCRFENTSNDLQDCLDNWYDKPIDELSEHELKAKKRLLEQCKEIAEMEIE